MRLGQVVIGGKYATSVQAESALREKMTTNRPICAERISESILTCLCPTGEAGPN